MDITLFLNCVVRVENYCENKHLDKKTLAEPSVFASKIQLPWFCRRKRWSSGRPLTCLGVGRKRGDLESGTIIHGQCALRFQGQLATRNLSMRRQKIDL